MGVPRENTIFEQASGEVDNGLWAKLHLHPPYIRGGSHGQGSKSPWVGEWIYQEKKIVSKEIINLTLS